jgi:hypothetical protein
MHLNDDHPLGFASREAATLRSRDTRFIAAAVRQRLFAEQAAGLLRQRPSQRYACGGVMLEVRVSGTLNVKCRSL